jgi:hypothetical protein
MIVKADGGFKASSGTGRPLSKKPKSRQAAMAQLYAVEMSKKKRGKETKAGVRQEMASAAHSMGKEK